MTILLEEHLGRIASPANLRINDQIRLLREKCKKIGCSRPYHHFAFGQSPFPPPPSVINALSMNAAQHDYLPTAGIEQLRELIAKYYNLKFNLNCSSKEIIVSPGSKEMISMILAAVKGSVIIPVPSWVSYLPQAVILKKEVIPIKTEFRNNFKLTPELLLEGISKSSNFQKILILNHPHNPTGTMYSKEELQDIAEICRRNNVVIIADEIYALTSFKQKSFVSMGEIFPDGTIVTGGLSKDRSAGGYRLGVGVFPSGQYELVDDILKIAGSTYSCVAAPIQFAAIEAYSMNETVESHIKICSEVNAVIGKYVTELFSNISGIKKSVPQGGFYLLIDFNENKEQLFNLGIKDSVNFAETLLQIEHTALLPGDALLVGRENFSFRCSFVDYDGEAALKNWRKRIPVNKGEEDEFVQENCSLMINGVKYIERFIEQIQNDVYPKHFPA